MSGWAGRVVCLPEWLTVAVETGLGEWLILSCLATHKYVAQEAIGGGVRTNLHLWKSNQAFI